MLALCMKKDVSASKHVWLRSFVVQDGEPGLTQNGLDATRIRGHTLNHILTRDSDNLRLTDVHIGEPVSDHKLVYTSISVNKPEPEVSEVRFRKNKK